MTFLLFVSFLLWTYKFMLLAVSFLVKASLTKLTLEWLLSCVYPDVHCQTVWNRKALSAVLASMLPELANLILLPHCWTSGQKRWPNAFICSWKIHKTQEHCQCTCYFIQIKLNIGTVLVNTDKLQYSYVLILVE